jgi:hypothetical protein
MVMRIIAALIMIDVGAFALYTVLAKAEHPYSGEPVDQAVGIPKIVTRIVRGGVRLFFIALGIISLLKVLRVMP